MTTVELLDQSPLRFSSDAKKGWSRTLKKQDFSYFETNGEKISSQAIIERINSLAIPPAWENVWICPQKNGHLQATGLDSKGRKQYRYHPLWAELSQQRKFEHMVEFAQILPQIRKHIQKTLVQKKITREVVLATIVWLLENTLIRIGNEAYETENNSFGLTTLKNRHVDVSESEVRFAFRGKSGVYHDVQIKSKKVAKIIAQCQELPGQDLFEYEDEVGALQTISSHDVNQYLQEISGAEVTAKDFRTWAGTMLAAKVVTKYGLQETSLATKKSITQAVKCVASHLRNLPSTCRKYYIHPAIFDAYIQGYTLANLSTHKKFASLRPIQNLSEVESGVIGLLALFECSDHRA